MDISISTGLYYKKDFIEILDIINETGCKNIELFLNQSFVDVPVNELEKEVTKRNMNVLSIHTPLEFIAFSKGETEDYWIGKCIEMSRILGSHIVNTHMVYADYSNIVRSELDDIHKDNILKYRGLKDILVTTENLPAHPNGGMLGKHDELLEFVKNNDVGITFDTTHCAYSGLSIIDEFKKFGESVKNIHLSDFSDGIEHKILGDGQLPVKEFMSVLKTINYQGLLTIELDFENKKRNDIQNTDQAVEGLAKCLDIVRSIKQ